MSQLQTGHSAIESSLPDGWPQEPQDRNKRVLFIRHGESEFNILHRINGNPRVPVSLTEKGREQAAEAGKRLKNEGIGAIVCSEFLRARQTAALIANELRLPVVVHRLANEVRTDETTEGMAAADFYQLIRDNPTTARIGAGCESFTDVMRRTQLLLEELAYCSADTILVVTHAWTLKSAGALKGDFTAMQAVTGRISVPNCSVIEGTFDPRGYAV